MDETGRDEDETTRGEIEMPRISELVGYRVDTPSGPGVILGTRWDVKGRLELHVSLDDDPQGETGLHVYLDDQCQVGRKSTSRRAREARELREAIQLTEEG
jgi:hypothetical protein